MTPRDDSPARGLRVANSGLVVTASLVALLVVVTHLNADLFSRGTLTTISPLVAIMIVVSIGQAFVIGTGGIDLSTPATMTIVGAITVQTSHGSDGGLLDALLIVVLACVAIGLLNGLLVERMALNAMVVTLATGQIVTGANRLYAGDLVAVADVPPRLTSWSEAGVGGLSYMLVVALVVAVAGGIALNRVVAGRRLVASSAAPRAAFLAGIRARRYRLLAWVVATLLYGLGALLLAGWVKTPNDTLGDPYLLAPIVAVVLGGAVLTGGRVSPVATLLGAVFIVLLDFNLRVLGLPTGARLIAQGAVLAVGVALITWLQHRQPIARALERVHDLSRTHLRGAAR